MAKRNVKDKGDVKMSKPGRYSSGEICVLLLWVIPLLLMIYLAFIRPEPKLSGTATERTALRVYSNTNYFRLLANPAEFGLEKLADVVNYLLLLAAAVLAFTTKSVQDHRIAVAKGEMKTNGLVPTRFEFLLYLHVGISCFFRWRAGYARICSCPTLLLWNLLPLQAT
jgi:hypothetical protein